MNYMLSMLAIAGVLFLSSCGDDEEDPIPSVNAPTVNLVAETGFITGDITATPGESFSIRVTVAKGDANLATYSVIRDGQALADLDQVEISNADNEGYTANFGPFAAPSNEGVYVYSYQVTDVDGEKGSVSWTVTVAGEANFAPMTSTSLGAQNAATGSSYNVENGTVYTLANAKANSDKVDFFYYYGSQNLATLWSPTDADANGDGIFGLPNDWATRNDTKIASSSLDFATATAADVLAATVSGTKANQLATGDVVIFETVGGIRGIAEVTVNGADDGTIDLDIKVVE